MECEGRDLTGVIFGGAFQLDGIDWPAPGKGHDRACWDDDVVLVADGVTPRPGEDGEVARFAEGALAALLHTRDRPDARAWFRAAIEVGAEERPACRGERSPFCTVVAVRQRGGDLELATLGDSLIVVRHGDATTAVADEEFSRFDAANFAAMKVDIDAGATFEEARAAIDHRLAQRRSALPRLVFADDPAAADRVISVTMPLAAVSHALLCTDGLSAGVDVLGQYRHPSALLDAVVADGLGSVAGRLREAETAPESLRHHPRYGRHDDLTAILLTRVGMGDAV